MANQALDMNVLSLALLCAAMVAFTRQRRMVTVVCAALFVPVAGLAAFLVYWPVSPVFVVLLLALAVGLPLATLLLYLIDLHFAPFCLEMTYPGMLCWLLWPALALVSFVGLLFR